MIKEYLYSSENIVHAIYEANDAIHEKNLLSSEDRQKLISFKDIFNEKLISEEVIIIKERLDDILNNNNFFESEVYFAPKGLDENKQRKYRPIHTASLTDQLCMIAMLNTITNDFSIYKEENNIIRKVRKFTPSYFYGNILSERPERVYEKWQDSYSAYLNQSIEMQNKFRSSLEYVDEITLDLQDFFPSINPEFILNYYMKHVSVNLNQYDKTFLKTILEKLLYIKCKINMQNNLQESLKHDYFKDYCGGNLREERECVYVRGIPQGLVQGGFFANLAMVEIANVYKKVFKGEQIFYVDDSIIYSNELKGLSEKEKKEKFEKLIEDCQIQINHYIEKELANTYESEYRYNISINKEKSSYMLLDKIKSGQIYLKNMSMLVSQLKSEMMTDFDVNDIVMSKNKLDILVQQIDKEIQQIDNLKNTKKKDFSEYRKRLVRYKKYFKYRFYILQFREKCNLQEIESEIKKLYNDLSRSLKDEEENHTIDIYNEEVIGPLITYLFKNSFNEIKFSGDTRVFDQCCKQMIKINRLLYYSEDNKSCSYFYKLYDEYIMGKDVISNYEVDKYQTLINLSNKVFANKRNIADNHKKEIVQSYIKDIIINKRKCSKLINIKKEANYYSIINQSSDELYRMIVNATISGILDISISDKFDFLRKGNRPLNYDELRVLSIIRNKQFKMEMLSYCNEIYSVESNEIDYSILEVISIFYQFVKDVYSIDKLILTHQYVCSLWRNGSKYLYFYTLHNQEHAIALIKSSIKIIRAINFLKIKRVDYYILFMSCYLHDISMVKIPDYSSFCKDIKQSNLIVNEFINEIDKQNLYDYKYTKNIMLHFYKAIDTYLEEVARKEHARESAFAIRQDNQLDFLNSLEREIIAQVSEAHGYEVRDIYRRKSEAQQMVCSIKYLKIILRLADLLDMKKNRISKELLQKNIAKMQEISAFHWISHLLINDLNIRGEYQANDNNETDWSKLAEEYKSFIDRDIISEKTILEIHTSEILLDKYIVSAPCVGVDMKEYNGNIVLNIKESKVKCKGNNCNITCKWFMGKNDYLIKECIELKRYLSDVPDNYFKNEIQIQIINDNNSVLAPEYLDVIKKKLDDKRA